ncbi:hypothetical protein AMK59_4302, partial [Oryctes borbonicus]
SRSILQKGGSAVDAAIAASFCEGVAMPQSTGLGGGFVMTVYKKSTNIIRTLNAREVCEGVAMPQSTGLGGGFVMTVYKKSTNIIRTLNAREVAPGAATEDMYNGNAGLAAKGGLAVAVPGELSGYW